MAAAPSFSGELLPAVTVPMPGMKAGFSAASDFEAGVGADALVAVDQNAVARFVAAPDRHDLGRRTRPCRRRRPPSGGSPSANWSCSSRLMPCDWARNSAVMPIISAPLLVRVNSLGLRSMPASIGKCCMCSSPPTICTSSAPATIACDA